MTNRILVVAPHADDELLGCGGTLLRRRDEGVEVDWLLVTGMSAAAGYAADRVARRAEEIAQVAAQVGFRKVTQLGFAPTRLDAQPLGTLVQRIGEAIEEAQPSEIFVPSPSDVHSDHRVVFDAVAGCAKWFRYPSVRRVLAYETLSETDFALDPGAAFRANVFVDISAQIERKLELLAIYASELAAFPFPRSVEAVRALAQVRGAASGFAAAEAFQLLRERL
ncbi:MAG TPA: PIG-L deacetylase family protein [Ramlibacter sp.]|uniref:PIG-L deacetylase family protein n=1 Tax=Ramlibacter sp. TaxID=1917967 RepID=UPI002C880C29|nr:PIG-L deacetylase family protein [Ramlibacter sp.]HVZ45354.1 PIG-L deacetylase family protein [Ramlibacter sp.]